MRNRLHLKSLPVIYASFLKNSSLQLGAAMVLSKTLVTGQTGAKLGAVWQTTGEPYKYVRKTILFKDFLLNGIVFLQLFSIMNGQSLKF